MHRFGVLVRAAGLAVALSVWLPPVASADCDGPVPSFREHAATAEHVFIGQVVAADPSAPWTDNQGRSSRFTVNVTHSLRGALEARFEARDLPYLTCADHIIMARPGDVIALAVKATGFSPPQTFTTVAWLSGEPFVDSVETIRVQGVYRLLDLTPPETATIDAASGAPAGMPALGLFSLGLVAGLAAVGVWARAGRPRLVHGRVRAARRQAARR